MLNGVYDVDAPPRGWLLEVQCLHSLQNHRNDVDESRCPYLLTQQTASKARNTGTIECRYLVSTGNNNHIFRNLGGRSLAKLPTMSYPRLFSQPFRYIRWASHEKPAIFYSIVIGSLGPASYLVAPLLRRAFGDDYERERIPLTYPGPTIPLPSNSTFFNRDRSFVMVVPSGPRKLPQGYEDAKDA